MEKFTKTRCLLAFLLAMATPAAAGAVSLLEAYQLALQSDPLIHEAEARRLASLEASPQARGLLLPQLSIGGSWAQDSISGRSAIQDQNAISTAETESENKTFGWAAELRQTLFRWDRIVGLKQSGKLIAKAEIDFEAALQDLIIRVALRYFEVLGAEDRLTSIHADRLAIAKQLEQAKQRFEVGRVAITDIQESQAAYDQAVAAEIQAKRELATARGFLQEITGKHVLMLSAPGENFPLQSPKPADERSWIELALGQNLRLVSSRFDEEIVREEISFRRTGHYPTVDLVVNYQRSDTDISNQTVDGVAFPDLRVSNQDVSIGIEFFLPIFAGGRTSSQVREAVYLHRASKEQLQRIARETERQARDAYLGVLSDVSRVIALEQAVKSSRTALEATQAGFEVGTRTVVDVLISQRSLYVAITNFYQSRYDYISNVLLLKLAAGTLGVQDLEQVNRFLIDRRPPEEIIAEEGQTKPTDKSADLR